MTDDNTPEKEAYAAIILYSFLLEERAKYQEQWESFENSVILKNRFFVESEILEEIELYAAKMTLPYSKGTLFYRARIFNKDPNEKFIEKYKQVLEENGENFEDYKKEYKNTEYLNFNLSMLENITLQENASVEPLMRYKLEAINRCRKSSLKGYDRKESLPPPAEKCVAGRANPEYVRYLYVCEDETTPIYEVKPSIRQNVSLAKLRLNRDIKVFDLSIDYCMDGDKMQGLFSFISEKFSIPNYNEDYKYIPTQCITEKIKTLGFDGIRFNSSLNAGGKNLVLFNVEDCEVVSTSLVEVANIKIETRAPGIYGDKKQESKPME